MVEFALASTLLFGTLFGVIQLGLGIWQYNLMAALAQDAARYASVRGSTVGTPATQSTLQSYVDPLAYGMTVTVAVAWSPNNSPGGTVTVTVSKSASQFTNFVPMAPTLSASASMIVSR